MRSFEAGSRLWNRERSSNPRRDHDRTSGNCDDDDDEDNEEEVVGDLLRTR